MQLERQRQGQRHPAEQADDERHQNQPRAGAEAGDPQPFGELLLDQPPAAGAERDAEGDFTVTDRRTREQQPGDVRAGDRENQSDRHQEQREEGADGRQAAELRGRAHRREQR